MIKNHDKILIAVDDSAVSRNVVTYVSQTIGRCPNMQVRLLHVLPPIPPELLEFGGAEDPDTEHRLSVALKEAQTRWIEETTRGAQPALDRLSTELKDAGVPASHITTACSVFIHKPNVVREILEAAETWHCGTIVVGRHAFSWMKELSYPHIGEALVRKGQGLTIWIVE